MLRNLFSAILCSVCCFAAFAGTSEKGYVNYEMFGAVGDGVHDDMAAIIAAHDAASQQNLPVKVTSGKSYYIGWKEKRSAEITTDTDFSDARFIIDDSTLPNRGIPIFVVKSSKEPVDIKGIGSLKKGQKRLGVKLPGRCLVEVVNDGQKVYIRYGLNQNNGTSQKEIVVAGPDGKIEESSALVWDYEKVTRATAYPVDDTPLTIRGGRFVTIANRAESKYNYYQRGIVIRRSKVTIEGMRYDVEGEIDHGAPYSGFIQPNHCVDIVVRDCVFTPHYTYVTIGSAGKPVSMGSYAINISNCSGVRFERCTQTRDIRDRHYWGLYTSNFCKNLTLVDCEMSRFDAHQGVENVYLKNCRFGHMGVQLVGFGKLVIEGCSIWRDRLVVLRPDYGSSWDGEIVIKDCTLYPGKARDAYVISGSNPGTHDFGYLCSLPSKLTIDGLTIDDSQISGKPYIFTGYGREEGAKDLQPLKATGTIILKNVKTSSGRPLEISTARETFGGYKIKTK